MTDITPIRQVPLTEQVLELLFERINQGVYAPGSRLPPENQLREEFNVSRSTLRAAISLLEDRKVLQRRVGIGTFVRENLNISNPLNEFIEFPRLIQENGFDPGFLPLSSEYNTANNDLAKTLQLEAGSQVLKIRKIFTADEEPIIYVVNHIPLWVFENILTPEQALDPRLTEKFMDFFEGVCQQRISHFVSTLKAEVLVNLEVPEILINEGPNTPVLIINEIGYNEDDRPVVSSREVHPGSRMTFRMLRRRGYT